MESTEILVTGGAGFIGSNISNELARANDVTVVDDCYLGDPRNLTTGVRFVEGSVLDDDLPTGVDVVMHLAALSSYAMHSSASLRFREKTNFEYSRASIASARKPTNASTSAGNPMSLNSRSIAAFVSSSHSSSGSGCGSGSLAPLTSGRRYSSGASLYRGDVIS